METRENYEKALIEMTKKAEEETTIWDVLRLLLSKFDREAYFDIIKHKLILKQEMWSISFYKQTTKTRYEFRFIGNDLGLFAMTDVFIIDLDVKKEKTLHNEVKRRFKKRYDMFEFETYDDCVIAFD